MALPTDRDVLRMPTLAATLSLVGGILYLLVGLLVLGSASVLSSALSGFRETFPVSTQFFQEAGLIGLVSGLVMVVSAVRMRSSSAKSVRISSALVLFFTFIGGVFTLGGFLIGFLLALVGSIMGLTWRPSRKLPEFREPTQLPGQVT